MKKHKQKNRTELRSAMSDEHYSILEPNALDLLRECAFQPKFYLQYADQLSDAEIEYDETLARFDVVKAEVDSDIRAHPNEYDLPDSVTAQEKVIPGKIVLDARYRGARMKVRRAKKRMLMLKNVVKALEHRKSSIENQVRLHGQKYFATPTLEMEAISELEAQRKRNVRRK